MNISISIVGSGLAAILGAGSIFLAIIGKSEWVIFLGTAVVLFIGSMAFGYYAEN